MATTELKTFSQKSQHVYPVPIFNTELEQLLRAKLGREYSVEKVAAYLDVTPSTMYKILAGCSTKLENAFRLAKLVNIPIEKIWELK